MTTDWSRVALEHIRRACEMYDSGVAIPKRPARSTFLLLSGKTYPAKFIRGLAYRLATGVELDPNRDYSGGTETVRFFRGMGLATQHEPASTPAPTAVIANARPPSPPQAAQRPPRQSSSPTRQHEKEPRKASLDAVLRQRFVEVEKDKKF